MRLTHLDRSPKIARCLGFVASVSCVIGLSMMPIPTFASASAAPLVQEFWAIAIPQKNIPPQASAKAIAQLKRHSEVIQHQPLFDAGEAKALNSLGQSSLSKSVRIRLSSAESMIRLASWSKSQGLPVTIEASQTQFGLESDILVTSASKGSAIQALGLKASDSLESLQWGLHNSGQTARLDIDDLTSIEVPGKPGEDIGLNRLPPNLPSTLPNTRIRVAVLDSGIDTSHPDLRKNLVTRPAECAKLEQYRTCQRTRDAQACDSEFLSQDADGNGYPLDCHGWNVATPLPNRTSGVWGDPDPRDDAGHGTHVAGIIGAELAPVTGTQGVAPEVEILPIKVIASAPLSPVRPQSDAHSPNAQSSPLPDAPAPSERTLRWTAGFTDLVARGLLYAIRSGAHVANLSMAWPQGADSPLMRQMVQLAQARGMLIVASAGNDSTDSRVMPCQYAGVICVASHGPDGSISHFSNHGAFVDIAAPGLSILSTWPIGKRQGRFFAYDGYELKNGTSMSAPFVTGAVAKMLAWGVPRQEIYARLLAGARPPQATHKKWIRSGNLDIARSLSVEPQPLILPAEKSVIKLDWNSNPISNEIPLTLRIRNFWATADALQISARLIAESGSSPGAELSLDRWSLEGLEADQTRELQTTLRVVSPALEGRLSIEVTVTDSASRARAFRQPVEISTPVSPGLPPSGGRILPIVGVDGSRLTLPRGAPIRSITPADGRPEQEYLAVQAKLGGATLYLLLEQPDGSYRAIVREGFAVPQGGELLQIQRLASAPQGDAERALIYRLPPQPGKPSAFRFIFINSAAEVTRQLDYANDITAITERFQWMRTSAPGKPLELAPAWIALGLTPPLEKPAFDPWRPKPQDRPKVRIYYLASDGLRSIQTGDWTPVEFLAPTPPQRSRGDVPILFSKGEGWTQTYSSALLGEAAYTQVRPLTLPRYRMLIGLQDRSEVTPWVSEQGVPGTLFAGPGASGSIRATAILSDGQVIDFSQEAPSLTSSLIRSVGFFTGERPTAVSQSQYDLIFTDIASGESRSTSLDRFSFLPSAITRRSFVPAVAQTGTQDEARRIPAIVIPGSLGSTQVTEVITPRYTQAGALEALVRTARLRLNAQSGCDALANPISATSDRPTEIAFACGDHLIRIPLIRP